MLTQITPPVSSHRDLLRAYSYQRHRFLLLCTLRKRLHSFAFINISHMFSTRLSIARSSRALHFPSGSLGNRTAFRPAIHNKTASRLISTTKMASFPVPSSDPPKHEMQYFPDMVNALPSTSAEFRRVLWTGLYTQLVLMTIPVGGDIGEEVSTIC